MIGGALGFVDGLSAWAYPEARTMMAAIVTCFVMIDFDTRDIVLEDNIVVTDRAGQVLF